jgi:zinc transporter
MAEAGYGSDKDGLVCGYLFAPERVGLPMDACAAAEWLTQHRLEDPDGFVWLHFNFSNLAARRWLNQNLPRPAEFHESLAQGAQSTRVEQAGEALVAVLNDVLFDFSFDVSDVATVALCVEPAVFVSARVKPLRSVDRLRAAIKEGDTFRSPAGLLAHLLRDQADVLAQIVRHSTSRVDAIEDGILAQRIASSRHELGSRRRALVRLQRLLAPEPAALFRLVSRPPAWVSGEDLQDLRESAEELSAAVTDSVTLVERVKLLQEELGALVNEQTNRTLFVLTIVTVLALPFNIIAGLFGMNVGGIPLAGHPHGFALVVVLVAAFTGAVGIWALRKRNQ